MTKMKRTTIWFDTETDRAALAAVRQRWGIDSDSAAWRFALRVLAQAERLDIVVSQDKIEEVKKNV